MYNQMVKVQRDRGDCGFGFGFGKTYPLSALRDARTGAKKPPLSKIICRENVSLLNHDLRIPLLEHLFQKCRGNDRRR
jgi:hypothetical protein